MSATEVLKLCQLQGCCISAPQENGDPLLAPKETLVYQSTSPPPAIFREFCSYVLGSKDNCVHNLFLTPLTCLIEDGTFRVRRRQQLRGILKDADEAEDGTRLISGEWIQTGTIQGIWTNSRFAKSLQDPSTMLSLPVYPKGETRPRST